jgi:DNA polymerase-3 subunit epsilon
LDPAETSAAVGSAWLNGSLLAFDIETTGLDVDRDVPVSVAFVRAEGRRIVKRASFLVDPGCQIPEAAVAVHGITTEMARTDGVPLDVAARRIAGSLHKAAAAHTPVVVMNGRFDLSMSDSLCIRQGLGGLEDLGLLVVDVLVLDRHVDRYRRGQRTLTALCEHYGAALLNAHDAASDASATLRVLGKMMDCYPEIADTEIKELTALQSDWYREQVQSLVEYRARVGQPPLDDADESWPFRGSRALA